MGILSARMCLECELLGISEGGRTQKHGQKINSPAGLATAYACTSGFRRFLVWKITFPVKEAIGSTSAERQKVS